MNNAKSIFRGADAVAAALDRIDAGTLFVMSGNQLMPLFDACLDHDFRLIHVRHEASAVHMADAWGRMTGTPGIALLPGGPGFLNGLTAIYTARMSESPVVVLSGHAPIASVGKGAFQEMPQAELALPLCKASWTVEKARDLGSAVQEAAAIALSGRPGPVHVALPFDLLNEIVQADFETLHDSAPSTAGQPNLAPILDAIAAAERPLILAGPLLCQPHLKQLHRTLYEGGLAPVVAMESPRGINDPALGALAEVLGAADLVVLLGKRADYTLRFGDALAKDARVVCIDPEDDELVRARKNLGDRLIFSVKADLRAAVAQLTSAACESNLADAEWCETVRSKIAFRPDAWGNIPDGADGRSHPVNAARHIQEALAAEPDAVIVIDGGEFGQWVQACIAAPNRIINGPSGEIGGGLPFAIAAKLAKPDSTVMSIMGDGTAGFCLAEFDTAARYGIAVTAIVGNDGRWNAEYQIQLRDYGPERLIGCELGDACYDKVAEGLGCHGEIAQASGDLPRCIERAMKTGKPACINLMIDGKPAPVIRTA